MTDFGCICIPFVGESARQIHLLVLTTGRDIAFDGNKWKLAEEEEKLFRIIAIEVGTLRKLAFGQIGEID